MALPFCLKIIFIISIFISSVIGFNVDLPTRIMHSTPQDGSMFGFTVALYKYGSLNTLLVGAPKFQTPQPGVWNGGAVLNCSSEDANAHCSYVPFDIGGNSVHNLGFAVDNKTNQFFGATLKASKEKGIVVACAPNYVWFTESIKRRDPVGTCYVARDGLTDFQEFSPCRTSKWGYHRQGSCQAGFDAAVTGDGERMYIGAPGAFYWQGQIHSQSLVVRNEYFTTGEGPATEDDQYMGYSAASGDFNGDGIEDMALGVPKGLNYTGKIALFSHNLTWIQNVTGDQLGSYFGYCLAVVDFNGDKLDDIVVGAPLYTDFKDREMKIEVGKVHILIQNSKHRFSRHVEYIGTVTRGRFGLSVTNLDDINLDGFGDIAVGAPYGGPDGRGAVFIYHGFPTAEGDIVTTDMKSPSQVIYASELGSGVSTFGWSLSGGVDMDDNQYPDLLVGAYETEKAFLFKSRPIIKFLEHKLEFKSKGKTIDLESNNCKIRRENFTCMDLVFCLAYTGVNVDNRMELEVEYRLDTKQNREQRMFFKSNDQNVLKENVSFRKEIVSCQTHRTYVKNDLVDKLTPISGNVSYTLIEAPRLTRSITPVLDQGQKLSLQDSLTIQKNCGPDNVCIPNLVLSFDTPKEFLIGDPGMLNVSIQVENKAEDAFESSVLISEPKGLLFNKFEPKESTSCSIRKIDGQNFLKCDIGNPLPKGQLVKFNVFFQQTGPLEKPQFDFIVVANSTNAEKPETAHDNTISRVVEAKIEMDLILFGSSDPDIIIYNTTQYQVPVRLNETHFGPSIIHKYGILNKGFAEIENVEIYILWPTRTLSGNHLLYLLEEPVTTGNIQCDKLPDVNPMNLKLMSKVEREKLLGISNLETRHSLDSLSEVERNKDRTSYSTSSKSTGGSYSSSSKQGGGSYSSSSSSSGGTYSSSRKETTYSSSQSGSGSSAVDSETGGGGTYSSSNIGGGSASSGRHGGGREGLSSTHGGSERVYVTTGYGGSGAGNASGGGSYSVTYSERRGPIVGLSETTRSGYDVDRSGTSGQHSYLSRTGGERGYVAGTDYSTQTGTGSGYAVHSENRGTTDYSSQSARERGYSVEAGGERRVLSPAERDRGYPIQIEEGGSSSSSSSGARVYSTHTDGNRGYSTSSGANKDYSSNSNRLEGHSSSSRTYGSSEADLARTLNVGSGGGLTSTLYSPSIHTQSGGASSVGTSDTTSSSQFGGGGQYHSSWNGDVQYSSSGRASGSEGSSRTYYSSSDSSKHSSGGNLPVDNQGGSYFSSSSRRVTSGGREPVMREGSYYSESHSEKSDPKSYTYHSSSSSSSTSSDGSYLQDDNDIASRKRRSLEEQFVNLVGECGATICTRIHCRTGRLRRNDDVYIYVRSRLFVDTLKEFVFPVDDLTISTRMVTKANALSYGIDERFIKVDSKNITTPIKSAKSLAEAPPIPWWVILLATLAGILILLLIILILWRCGYFKRHRPRHQATIMDDSQPLNPPTNGATNGSTNGVNGKHRTRTYYPGDEAL